jgi:hypothetical protein
MRPTTTAHRGTAVFALSVLSLCAIPARAQSPNPAANGPVKQDDQGLYPGWGLGARLEGSTSSDGSVYDLGIGAGYNFSHRFGVDIGVPYFFVSTPSAVKGKNPQAVSGNGLGDFGADLKMFLPGKATNLVSTLHLAAPTGDKKKGFSTGHGTWNLANHLEHGWGMFTPFVNGGVGNTIADTRYFHRPYASFGYNAQFEAGTEIDAGPVSLMASAYDVAPWGSQTIVSRVFRCNSGGTCGSSGKTTNRKGYLNSNVSTGDASLARDNGFNFGAEFKPVKAVDLEVDYSRSVPLRLNTFSFGIALDIAGVLRSRAH